LRIVPVWHQKKSVIVDVDLVSLMQARVFSQIQFQTMGIHTIVKKLGSIIAEVHESDKTI